MYSNTQGIVLRETNYKESDKILTVLTAEGGKRTVKARGCRRKGSQLTACTQLLVYSDMTLYQKQERFTLTEASSLNQFWTLRQDMDRLALGSYFAEVVEAVADEGHPDPDLLSLLLNSLYALDKLPRPLPLIKAAFELKLLAIVGYEPQLMACAGCGDPLPKEPRLNLSQGLLHCTGCDGGEGISLPLDASSLQAMRHVIYGDPKRIFSFAMDESGLQRLGDVTEAFLLTQLERGWRTLDFYKQLQAMAMPNIG